MKKLIINESIEKIIDSIKNEDQLLEFLKQCDELKNYQLGLNILKEKEDIIAHNFYKILKYKILFNKQTNNLFEAKRLIVNELNLPYIPKDTEEFLVKELKEINYEVKNNKAFDFEIIEQLDKLSNDELFANLSNLRKINLTSYTDKLQFVFENKNIQDITKSLLLAILSDQKLNYDFKIVKSDYTIIANPITVKDLRDDDSTLYIQEVLKKVANFFHSNDFLTLNDIISAQCLVVYPYFYNKNECQSLIIGAVLFLNEITNNNNSIEIFEFYDPNKIQNYQFMKEIIKKGISNSTN